MSDQIRNRLKYLKKNNLLTPEQEIKQLQADNTLLVEGLEAIEKHQTIVAGSFGGMSTTLKIARETLEKVRK